MSIVSICGSKKRDSTLEEHYRGYGFHDWLQSINFIVIGRDPWIKKWANYLSCLEEKEGLKDIHRIAKKYRTICWSIIRYLLILVCILQLLL